MSVRGTVLAVLLCALLHAPPARAQEYSTIFNGAVGARRVVALQVDGARDIGELIDELRRFAAPDTTLIAYADQQAVSATEPLVVYVDGENVFFAQQPRTATDPPTLADTMQNAMRVERGAKSGAICRDGSRTELTNNGACSFSGGVDRWLYEAVARSDAEQVVAAICEDYRLVAGEGAACDDSDVLVQIHARLYPDPEPVDPAATEADAPAPPPPTERAVAPLPEPEVAAPAVDDSSVAWTSRSAGQVGFSWTVSLSNGNNQPVRAVVAANLRDASGKIIHTDERVVALGAGASGEFSHDGTVAEEEALLGERWTFSVELTDEDEPLTAAELASVRMVVDPLVEEVRITNTSDGELDLNQWTLTSTVGGESFTFRFFRLDAGETVVLTSGEGARSLLPEIYLWTSSEVWTDAGDAAELRDAEGRLRARTNPDGSAAVVVDGRGRQVSR